jgi:hypothetical protein
MAPNAKAPPKKKTGRPSLFSEVLADEICERLVNGESLRSICLDEKMPSVGTALRWVGEKEAFREHYSRARDLQADVLFDETLKIADTPMPGIKTVTKASGVETTEGDMIDHRRLQIDTRKWIAGKLRPKKYGDKSNVEVSGPDGGPIETLNVTDAERAAALMAFLAKVRPAGAK